MKKTQTITFGVFVCVAVWYVSTLTAVHTFDALSYILDVQRKPWTELFHPHHLAYGPLGSLATWFTAGDAALAMQWVNALAGALGVSMLARIVYRRWQRLDLTLLAALALGGSYAYWYYAVEVEVYTLAACFLLWIIWLIDHPQPTQRSWYIRLGCAIAGAVLFHQTNVLVGIPLMVIALADIRTTITHWRGWAAAAIIAGIIIMTSYAVVMVGVSGFRDWASMHAWLFQYANTGWWGGKAGFADLSKGVSDAIAWQYGAWYGLAMLTVSLAQLRITPLTTQQAWMWVWLITYGVFFTWWEPDNIEFWIAVTPLAVLLLIAPLRHGQPWRGGVVVALGLALAMAYTNDGAIRQRGNAQSDLQRDIARFTVAHSNEADLLLIPDGLQELYLPYYHQRDHVLSVNSAMSTQGNWQDACTLIQGAVAQSQQAGAAILLSDDFLTPSLVMQQRFQLATHDISDCVGAVLPYATTLVAPAPIPSIQRIPTPGEQLRDGAWQQLPGAPMGWQIFHATTQASTQPGWQLQVHEDPALVSPILDIPLPQAIAVRIHTNGTADQQAQLFVATALNQFSEEASVHWQIPADGAEYRIDVRNMSLPTDRLLQIRLDPVADGADGTVTLIGIRIIP